VDADDDEDADPDVNLEDENDLEPGTDNMEEADEIDPAVDESDAEMIRETVEEIAAEGRLSPLTDEEIKLGQYSIAKVSLSSFIFPHMNTTHNCTI
jgi:hypothetical protein